MIVPTLCVAFFIRRVVRRSDDDVCIEDRPPGRFMRAGRRFSFERNKSPTDQVYRRSGSGCWAYPLPLIMPTGDVLAFSREDSFEAVVLPHLDAATTSPVGSCVMPTLRKTYCRMRSCGVDHRHVDARSHRRSLAEAFSDRRVPVGAQGVPAVLERLSDLDQPGDLARAAGVSRKR
jgi:hypothetical protein